MLHNIGPRYNGIGCVGVHIQNYADDLLFIPTHTYNPQP